MALGRRMEIMSLDIEGLSMAKCTYLSVLLREHGVDGLALQETHLLEDSSPSRYSIDWYWIVSRNDHRHYGSAVYTSNSCQAEEIKTSMDQDHIHINEIKYQDVSIVNIYKPPVTTWPEPPVPHYEHPYVFLGNFNSHHTTWGYRHNNADGKALVEWQSHCAICSCSALLGGELTPIRTLCLPQKMQWVHRCGPSMKFWSSS